MSIKKDNIGIFLIVIILATFYFISQHAEKEEALLETKQIQIKQ